MIFILMLMSLLGRGARFYLVAAIVRWGGERYEATLLKQIEVIGWSTLAILGILIIAYVVWPFG